MSVKSLEVLISYSQWNLAGVLLKLHRSLCPSAPDIGYYILLQRLSLRVLKLPFYPERPMEKPLQTLQIEPVHHENIPI